MSEDVKPQIWIIFKSNDQEAKLIELEPTLQLMKEMGEALEHYEACHYDLRGHPCSHDKTASEALEKYRKFLEGIQK